MSQILICYIYKYLWNKCARFKQDTCQGSFTVSHMNSLETWLDVVVMGWIRLLYSASSHGLVRITKLEVNL